MIFFFFTDNLIQAGPVIEKAKTNAPSKTENLNMEDRLDLQELGCSEKINMLKFSNHHCCPKID